ncbi:AI-2E family transporter [Candidatus Woesebacteria bacterium]|nr:AI-2E family transporter [Candidatus Woesebacteria bacterium]
MTQRIEISWKTIVFTVVFLIGLQALWIVKELIFTLFLAFIFMSALKPVVNKLTKRGIPRTAASFLVLASTVAWLIFVLAFILPPIVTESISFLTNLPTLLIEAFPFFEKIFTAESAIRFFPNIPQNIFKIASGLFSNVFFIVSLIFFTFYFLLEEIFLQKFLQKIMSHQEAKKVTEFTQKLELRMGAWMRGQLILMLVIGLTTYIGLSILGIRYALSLAVVAGLLEVIPIIGPVVSSIPAFLVASATSTFSGGTTIILYLLIQQLENNILVPYVMSKTAGINPIMTLIALSVGGSLAGLLGAILAVPVAVVVETVVSEYFDRRSS